VDRAGAARDQQCSARIFLDHAALGEALLAHGIGGVAGHGLGLERARQHLQEQRVARVALAHPCDEAARHEQWKVGSQQRVEAPGRQLEQPLELGDVADRVAHRRSPRRSTQVGRHGGWVRRVDRLKPRFVLGGS
jgi:hypothetical protein